MLGAAGTWLLVGAVHNANALNHFPPFMDHQTQISQLQADVETLRAQLQAAHKAARETDTRIILMDHAVALLCAARPEQERALILQALQNAKSTLEGKGFPDVGRSFISHLEKHAASRDGALPPPDLG